MVSVEVMILERPEVYPAERALHCVAVAYTKVARLSITNGRASHEAGERKSAGILTALAQQAL